MTDAALLALSIVVAVLFVAGLAGAIVPFVPGTPLILLGAIIYAVATRFTIVGLGRLIVLALIAALAYLVEHAAGALGARRSGGSAWAVVGALVGALLGFLVFPVGLLIGPIVGAVVGELLHGRDLRQSVQSGIGAFIGTLVGAVAHLVLALVMIGLFLWWVWWPSA